MCVAVCRFLGASQDGVTANQNDIEPYWKVVKKARAVRLRRRLDTTVFTTLPILVQMESGVARGATTLSERDVTVPNLLSHEAHWAHQRRVDESPIIEVVDGTKRFFVCQVICYALSLFFLLFLSLSVSLSLSLSLSLCKIDKISVCYILLLHHVPKYVLLLSCSRTSVSSIAPSS
jgi:hypothetical protein